MRPHSAYISLQTHTRALYRNWPGLVLAKQARMAFSHLAAEPSRVRYHTTGFRVPENTPNGQKYPIGKMPLAPLSCLSTTYHPPIVLNHQQNSPHGPLLLSRTISYLRHDLTGLWVPEKHIQRTNSRTDPAPLTLGLAACSPPFHPPIVFNRRGTSPHGSSSP